MMAAKLLMSLVIRAVAVENAAIRAASSHRQYGEHEQPGPVDSEPEPDPHGHDHDSKTVIIISPERIGPISMAKRLAGVTRNRSMSPDCNSKMVPNPAPLPLAKANRDRMPGRNSSRTLPVGNPRLRGDPSGGG